MGFKPMALSYQLFRFVVQPLRLQPILKGLSGDADHVADADRLEQSGVGEFIGRGAANTENGCDVIHRRIQMESTWRAVSVVHGYLRSFVSSRVESRTERKCQVYLRND